jgi:hypothetical protein
MDIKKRARERKKRIVIHLARNFDEAEKWDLEFWQNQSPEMRLSAFVALRKDVEKVKKKRSNLLKDED